MEVWETYFTRAVQDGRLRDTPDTRKGYKRMWNQVGTAYGLKKDPKPCPPRTDETDWLYD